MVNEDNGYTTASRSGLMPIFTSGYTEYMGCSMIVARDKMFSIEDQ